MSDVNVLQLITLLAKYKDQPLPADVAKFATAFAVDTLAAEALRRERKRDRLSKLKT